MMQPLFLNLIAALGEATGAAAQADAAPGAAGASGDASSFASLVQALLAGEGVPVPEGGVPAEGTQPGRGFDTVEDAPEDGLDTNAMPESGHPKTPGHAPPPELSPSIPASENAPAPPGVPGMPAAPPHRPEQTALIPPAPEVPSPPRYEGHPLPTPAPAGEALGAAHGTVGIGGRAGAGRHTAPTTVEAGPPANAAARGHLLSAIPGAGQGTAGEETRVSTPAEPGVSAMRDGRTGVSVQGAPPAGGGIQPGRSTAPFAPSPDPSLPDLVSASGGPQGKEADLGTSPILGAESSSRPTAAPRTASEAAVAPPAATVHRPARTGDRSFDLDLHGRREPLGRREALRIFHQTSSLHRHVAREDGQSGSAARHPGHAGTLLRETPLPNEVHAADPPVHSGRAAGADSAASDSNTRTAMTAGAGHAPAGTPSPAAVPPSGFRPGAGAQGQDAPGNGPETLHEVVLRASPGDRPGAAERVPEPAPPRPVSLGQLASELVSRARSLEDGKGVELRFRMDPPELGSIRVRMEARGEHVRVELHVSSSLGSESLSQSQHRLEQRLQDAGFRQAQVEIHTGTPSSHSGQPQHSHGQPGAPRHAPAAPSAPGDAPTPDRTPAPSHTGHAGRLDRTA